MGEQIPLYFLTRFSVLSFFLSSKYTIQQYADLRPYKRQMIASIDTFLCRRCDMGENDITLEAMTKSEYFTRYAVLMARAMYAFALCHEIGHLILEHQKKRFKSSIERELEADYAANQIFELLIKDEEQHKYLEMMDGLSRAPLALFDIYDLVDYYKREILDVETEGGDHPRPYMRRASLLDGFGFNDNENSFNLYSVLSERASSLKYYIHKHKVQMRNIILEIHSADKI